MAMAKIQPGLAIYLGREAPYYLALFDDLVKRLNAGNRSAFIRALCDGELIVLRPEDMPADSTSQYIPALQVIADQLGIS